MHVQHVYHNNNVQRQRVHMTTRHNNMIIITTIIRATEVCTHDITAT